MPVEHLNTQMNEIHRQCLLLMFVQNQSELRNHSAQNETQMTENIVDITNEYAKSIRVRLRMIK
jgi:hypothetical protein